MSFTECCDLIIYLHSVCLMLAMAKLFSTSFKFVTWYYSYHSLLKAYPMHSPCTVSQHLFHQMIQSTLEKKLRVRY